MSRNPKGQFEKGTTGNPKGRPRKRPHPISDGQIRSDFFEAAEMLVPVVAGNKREMIPARLAIDKQLVIRAASGDMRAICEYNKRRERYTFEHVKQQLKSLELIFEAEDRIRMFPEDVTDEYKRVLALLRMKIDPDYLL
ncbi:MULTISPECIES: DUF5681 domain-containing protein [Bradyrhizobium]|uniref:DUF5681 domain-containing protein n=2 Tax=Nitrobacteraceae TaxID=41294 RepID=UPI001177FDEB|nr:MULTISPECIES: DUF5681 domain-containing protein [Bradyrhizobium]MCK1331283.1 hypothetical protein [Bradyrhizobium sp. CW9]MCK1547561.1 hypothetical protein [Bradyrhizobium sp. 177]MCK1633512.1 hypothetical protein [Bradyrhizobium sp. 162]MCK1696787.1 hypothetical protein [Bradyrhizobium sp. 144]